MGREYWEDEEEEPWVASDPPALVWLRRLRRPPVLAGLSALLLIAVVASVLAVGLAGSGTGTALPRRTLPGVNSGTSQSGGTAQALAPVPAGMPSHFAFGLGNGPGSVGLMNEMRSHNGTAWDYRYQYLAGGVNTGHGWETWNSPPGQFATFYIDDSVSNRYLPAFVYYELRQSNGPCTSCDDGSADRANLSTPSVMAAYYANWRLLMQRIGASHKTVLVVVEPDLWGYMEQWVVYASNSAADVPASVASSGDVDAAGLPNTAQGFAWALLRMRDRYAPNALLALHASGWATYRDIGSSTDVALDAQAIARTTAQFLLTAGLRSNTRGISTWDVLSNDVADRDSAQGSAWWDRTNRVYPNFTRYLSYVSALSLATGRRVVMWQVPEGNQYFDTMNDAPHHTQDNRAEYILGHVADFARAGVVAVLFGPGNGGTNVSDEAHDGITNPAPITSYQCDRCNTHVSTYPDDDGGYLRLFVGAYYKAGALSLAAPETWSAPRAPSVLTATAGASGACEFTPAAAVGQVTVTPNPAAAGGRITVTAYVTLSCNTDAALEVDVYTGSTSVLKLPDFHERFTAGQARRITFTGTLPATIPAGSHALSVGVFSTSFKTLYGYKPYATYLQVQ
jgi:hypothetical protein